MKRLKLNSEKLFFTSDLHFNHKNIIKFCNRPYENIDEMNNGIIDNWNSVVPKDGIVLLLGDVSWKGKNETEHLLDQLNGTVYFIEGNHDPEWVSKHYENSYDTLLVKLTDNEDGYEYDLHLSHYPLLEWYRSQNGGIHLHGHCHGSNDVIDSTNYQRLDVGLDSHDMFPISWDKIKTILNQRYLKRNG